MPVESEDRKIEFEVGMKLKATINMTEPESNSGELIWEKGVVGTVENIDKTDTYRNLYIRFESGRLILVNDAAPMELA